MSSDLTSPEPAIQIEDLPAGDTAPATQADAVRGGFSWGAVNTGSHVKASPTGDADYLPYGKLNPVPGLGTT
jgi:hypothetical protein